MRYVYGPVPSRRLGQSLGIDPIPLKTCNWNCVYCQLGRHGKQTLERRSYVPAEAMLGELRQRLAEGLRADHITFSGSGEPTLNLELGAMIDGVRALTDTKVAVITNGTLLSDAGVRADCSKADVVLPSLDAGDAKTFEQINRPHENIRFETFVAGLCRFREEYRGPIWLEVFLLEGVNTGEDQIERMKELIGRIRPDKVQLNTAVRPGTEADIAAVDEARLAAIAERLGDQAEVIAEFGRPAKGGVAGQTAGRIIDMLQRRPCSLEDVCGGLGIDGEAAKRQLEKLAAIGRVRTETRGGVVFYVAAS